LAIGSLRAISLHASRHLGARLARRVGATCPPAHVEVTVLCSGDSRVPLHTFDGLARAPCLTVTSSW
jgi:hypothetical protein